MYLAFCFLKHKNARVPATYRLRSRCQPGLRTMNLLRRMEVLQECVSRSWLQMGICKLLLRANARLLLRSHPFAVSCHVLEHEHAVHEHAVDHLMLLEHASALLLACDIHSDLLHR